MSLVTYKAKENPKLVNQHQDEQTKAYNILQYLKIIVDHININFYHNTKLELCINGQEIKVQSLSILIDPMIRL